MCGASSCPDAPGERALREVSASRQPRGPQGLLPSFPVPVCAPACYGDRTLESDGARAPSALLAAPPASRTPGRIGRQGRRRTDAERGDDMGWRSRPTSVTPRRAELPSGRARSRPPSLRHRRESLAFCHYSAVTATLRGPSLHMPPAL